MKKHPALQAVNKCSETGIGMVPDMGRDEENPDKHVCDSY
jgi:hypothetical protein